MRKRSGVILAILKLWAGPPGVVLASGYSVYERGAKGMANAGAFTARADDPSALFFNPAGIVQLKGKRLSVGTNPIFLTGSELDSTSGNSFDQVDNMAWPSNVYYTQMAGGGYGWGLSITSPFGLKTEWDETFEGRYIARVEPRSVQVGYGYAGNGGFTFDVAYQALFFDNRTATGSPASASDPVQPGEYENFTSLLGINLGWAFANQGRSPWRSGRSATS